MREPLSFAARYGPWALVTGAAQGIGFAFAEALSARGLGVFLLDRQADALEEARRKLEARGALVRAVACDLADRAFIEAVEKATRDYEIGLLVSNAGVSRLGPFLDGTAEEDLRMLEINCAAAVSLLHRFGPPMRERRRGGIILLSSNSAYLHTPLYAHYAATKAFLLSLGEALWQELRGEGVDVLALAPGMTRTPALAKDRPRLPEGSALLTEPRVVVERALVALGRRPSLVPNLADALGSFLLARLLPRRAALAVARRSIERFFPDAAR